MKSVFLKSITLLTIVLGGGFFLFPPIVNAQNPTTVGSLTLTATLKSISVYSSHAGDDNGNNQAVLEYKESTSSTWQDGISMTVDRRASVIVGGSYLSNPYYQQWRSSIFWLQANTEYDVRVTFTDADGVTGTNPVTASVTTRNDNPPSTGNTYYVSPTGTDTTCVNGNTFGTIQQAANCAQPGDTVYIRAGTYNEKITLSANGTTNNYIVFRAFGNDDVTIDGGCSRAHNFDIGTFNKDGASAAYLGGGDYVRIIGLKLKNANSVAIRVGGSNVFIENNEIIDWNCADTLAAAQAAISSSWEANNLTILGNTIRRDIGQLVWTTSDGIFFGGTGPNTEKTGGYGHVIAGNKIIGRYGYNGDVIGNIKDSIGSYPESFIPSFIRDSDIYDNELNGCSDDNIQAEGGDINVRIWNNTLKNCRMGLAIAPTIIGPLYFIRNVITSNLPDGAAFKMGVNSEAPVYAYHNTIYYQTQLQDGVNGPSTKAASGITLPRNVEFKNNIVYVDRYVYENPVKNDNSSTFNYNFLYTPDPTRFIQWNGPKYYSLSAFQTGTGQELNSISTSDVRFVDAATGDFRLQSTSPVIDKGTIIPGINDANSLWPYRGLRPDLGAFEYDSGAPVDITPPVRSNGQPTGTLVTGTTSTIINLTATDTTPPVTCRYSTTPNTPYSSMTGVMTNTAGNTYSATVSGLSDGNTYNYYVRCQDSLGNANTDDFPISFSIATPSGGMTFNFIADVTTEETALGMVEYGGNLYIAAHTNPKNGGPGTIIRYNSITGSYGTAYSIPSGQGLGDIRVLNNKIYVTSLDFGGNNAIFIYDGSTWLTTTLGLSTLGLVDITYYNGRFYVGGYTGAGNPVIYTSLTGESNSWSAFYTRSIANRFTKLEVFNNKLFFTPEISQRTTPPMNTETNEIYSYDGVTVTPINFSTELMGVTDLEVFNSALYLSVWSQNSNVSGMWRTTDGVNFSQVSFFGPSALKAPKLVDLITFNNKLYAAEFNTPTSIIYESADGTSWAQVDSLPTTLPTIGTNTDTAWHRKIALGVYRGRLYAVPPAQGRLYVSTSTPSFDFSVSASPTSGSVTQGGSTTATVTVSLVSGTTQAVSLSASGMSIGSTVSFTPTSCNPSCSSTMTISTAANTPTGSYIITITGTGGGVTRTTSYSLTTNALDTTPPFRSSGQPSGILAPGTIQTTISLATNEAATCRYSTTANTPYSSMTNTFTTTGGTSHSRAVSGLSDGNPYNYYVRCQDAAGNPNTSDTLIAFQVTVLGDISSPTPGARDGRVNIYDVSRLLSKWGSTNSQDLAEADINPGPNNISQGKIDIYDANKMMANWLP